MEVVEIPSLGKTTMKARKNQVFLQVEAEEEEEAEVEVEAETAVVEIFLIFSVIIAIVLATPKHIAG